jgi:hypothetical protein
LTTKSPLHIGSGNEEPRAGLTKKEGEKDEEITISAVAKDIYRRFSHIGIAPNFIKINPKNLLYPIYNR